MESNRESNWTKAEFRVTSKLQGVPGELVRLANETLARELTISLSAFLRTSVTATHTSGGEISFGEFPVADSKACFGLAVVRPGDRKLVLVVEYSVLLALGGHRPGRQSGLLRRGGPQAHRDRIASGQPVVPHDSFRCVPELGDADGDAARDGDAGV